MGRFSFSRNPWEKALQIALLFIAGVLLVMIASFYQPPSEMEKAKWHCESIHEDLDNKPTGELSINNLKALRTCRELGF